MVTIPDMTVRQLISTRDWLDIKKDLKRFIYPNRRTGADNRGLRAI